MGSNQFGKQGWTPERIDNLQGKTYFITGANAGAGYQATRILLGEGARVVMLNRNDQKSQAAVESLKEEFGAETQVSYFKMDLANLASIRAAAEAIHQSDFQIDALICNAAIAQVSKQEFTADGFESQLGTNHYGHFLLINLLFDRIEQARGRIVVVASMGYNMGIKTIQFDDMNWDKNYHPNKVYSQSKLAQMMTAYELQDRIQASGKNVSVYVCHPGASNTTLIRKDAPLMTRVMWSILSRTSMVQSAEKGSYPEVMCATEPDLKQRAFYGPTGRNYWTGPVGECKLEPHALDKPVMEKLWTLSEEETGCNWKH